MFKVAPDAIHVLTSGWLASVVLISTLPLFIYRLMHLVSELSGITCTSSLTMNEKFQYRTRLPSVVLKIFDFIISERVQVNPDNSRAMSALTFLLLKLNKLQAKIVKF